MANIGQSPIIDDAKHKRSDVGIELVRVLSHEGFRIFSIKRAREFSARVGIKNSYLPEALYHLRQTGWIVALRRGLYAISPSVPGVPPAHEFEIAMALVEPAAISHWSALHYHGLTDQASRNVFILTTTGAIVPRARRASALRSAGQVTIAGIEYRFVKTKPQRFFGLEKVWFGEAQVMMTDPERTLLDGLSMPQYFGDFAEVLDAFELRFAHLDLKRIIDYAQRLDTATAKRLGWILDSHGISTIQLQPLLDLPIKGFRRLDPTGPLKGPYNRRWMIQENLPGSVQR